MLPNPLNMKSEPARTIGSVRDVRRMSDSLIRASLPEHDSRLRIIAMRFSDISSRSQDGTDAATLAPSMPPFCTPWAPIARASATHRASRYSMDLRSAPAISTSAPAPDETRIFMPRDAYAEVRNALDQGVSSPSTNTCSVPYRETVSAYEVS